MRAGRLGGMGFAAFLLFCSASQGQDSLNVTRVGELDIGEYIVGIVLQDTLAYAACGEAGFAVINISAPTNPILLALSDTPGMVEAIAVDSTYVYVLGSYCGFRVFDISIPTNPIEVGALPFLSYRNFSISNGFAYVCNPTGAYEDFVLIVNIIDPLNPEVASGFYPSPIYWIEGLEACEELLYLSGEGSDLLIYDISNAPSLSLVGHADLDDLGPIDVVGNYCYMACYFSAGLEIIDVSNPAQPFLVGNLQWPGAPADIFSVEPHAFVADLYVGLRIINVTDPANAFEVGYYASGSQAVSAIGDYAYVGEGLLFRIYDCSAALPVNPWETTLSQPSSFVLHPPHPNPFNPTTILTFDLPVAGWVKLEVFDINGRSVGAGFKPAPTGGGSTPALQFFPAGTHQIHFDGSGLPSGIYLARLTAGDFQQTQKLVLLK